MEKAIVTVIVTVYQIEKYLDRFFECLQAQTFPGYTALIIDDGSTDGSLSVCRKYAAGDDRVRIITTEHIGISAARNMAMEMLDTPFATSLDGDDYFDRNYLKHLVDAQKRYDADLVISNVIYVNEDGSERKRFVPRPEAVYTKESFPALLPALLEEERLNYLYGKLYRTEYLKDVRVEPDVKQGSDTMINCQYVLKIDSIAVIEDYDYHYVRFRNTRSVTSYNGNDVFHRLYRINRFVEETMDGAGYLNDEMRRVIDGRIMLSGYYAVAGIGKTDKPLSVKRRLAEKALHTEEYLTAYNRQKTLGNLGSYGFEPPAPDRTPEVLLQWHERALAEKKDRKRGRIRSLCPDFIFRIYHQIKIKMGLIPPDAHDA